MIACHQVKVNTRAEESDDWQLDRPAACCVYTGGASRHKLGTQKDKEKGTTCHLTLVVGCGSEWVLPSG